MPEQPAGGRVASFCNNIFCAAALLAIVRFLRALIQAKWKTVRFLLRSGFAATMDRRPAEHILGTAVARRYSSEVILDGRMKPKQSSHRTRIRHAPVR